MVLKSVKTPVTIRGVTAYQQSDRNTVYDCLIDYFVCSLKKHTLNDVFSYFGNDYVILNTATHCYDYTIVFCEKIKVLVSNRKDMNICINLSGRACREIETHYSWFSFFTFCELYKSININKQVDLNFNVTRLDYTFDFYNLNYDLIKRVENSFNKDNYTSLLHKVYLTTEKTKHEITGRSVRFGKRGSDCSILFYDKLLERSNANHEVDKSIKKWYRMETNFLGDTAMLVYSKIKDDDCTSFVCSLIYKYLDFKVKNNFNSRNQYKSKTCLWWKKLLNDCNKLKLSKKAVQCSIDRKLAWFDKSVVKTLALLSITREVTDGVCDVNLLNEYISKGCKKLSDYDFQLLNSYLVSQGHRVITKEQFSDIVSNFT